jgi:pyruvate/2-oxoglutarate dehydrogenase complex dihydrolipoamide dehydrogenase (E3) component
VVNASSYDLVVIGGGTAGLVCAVGAAGLGARVALLERHRLGGDCLNTGCVPSKALLAAARSALDFATAMARVRGAIAAIAPHDSAERLASLGVEVIHAHAAFRSPAEIVVDGRTLGFRRAVIATGSRPAIPDIAGLAATPYLTNETLFSLATQPRALAVLGGGPVGCEMAQAFARLGTRVTLIESAARLLPRDDPDAAAILTRRLEAEGVCVLTDARVTTIAHEAGTIALTHAGGRVAADALLVATGRTPNTADLGLAAARIGVDARGVRVDDFLRTTNTRVYASGDVCSSFRFTHAADAMSRIVVENACFVRRRRVSRLVIPWCTFTMPEIAHVGIDARQASDEGVAAITIPLAEIDRAVIDDDTDGFVRIRHERGTILGATIVAPHAGEMIAAVSMLMQKRGTLADLSATIVPYPIVGAGLRQAGDEFRPEALTPRVRAVLRAYFRLLR